MPALEANTFQWAIDLNRSIGEYVSEARVRRRRGQVLFQRPTPAEVTGQGMDGLDEVHTTTATLAAMSLSPAQSEVRLPGLGSGRIALDQLKEARAIVLKVLRCRVKPETQSKLAIAIDTVVVEEIR